MKEGTSSDPLMHTVFLLSITKLKETIADTV